ncbi:hypothetical protein F170042I7_20320 [Blautia caecimuris]|uniref:hypothetical protein n=1 Tax=Blautia caecimuris TaxID=1796615 RepID=UPI0034BCCFB3
MDLKNKLTTMAVVDALLFHAFGSKIDKSNYDNDNSFYGTISFYISVPEHVSVKISDEILDDIESDIEDINEAIKTQNGLFSFIKERMIGIASLGLYDESFDEEDINILRSVFKIYIKTRKGENLDQDMYEKKCNEFYNNFEKNMKEYRMTSEYQEV